MSIKNDYYDSIKNNNYDKIRNILSSNSLSYEEKQEGFLQAVQFKDIEMIDFLINREEIFPDYNKGKSLEIALNIMKKDKNPIIFDLIVNHDKINLNDFNAIILNNFSQFNDENLISFLFTYNEIDPSVNNFESLFIAITYDCKKTLDLFLNHKKVLPQIENLKFKIVNAALNNSDNSILMFLINNNIFKKYINMEIINLIKEKTNDSEIIDSLTIQTMKKNIKSF